MPSAYVEVPVREVCRRLLEGLPIILKYIARAAAPETPPLYGKTALESCTIDQWMEFCSREFVSGPGLQAAVASAGEPPLPNSCCVHQCSTSLRDFSIWNPENSPNKY